MFQHDAQGRELPSQRPEDALNEDRFAVVDVDVGVDDFTIAVDQVGAGNGVDEAVDQADRGGASPQRVDP